MRWTPEDIIKLEDIVEQGVGVTELVAAFPGRTYNSIDHAYRRYFGCGVFTELNKAMMRNSAEQNSHGLEEQDNGTTDYDGILHEIGKRKEPYTLLQMCDLLQVAPSVAKEIIAGAKGRGVALNVSEDGYVLKGTGGYNVRPIQLKPIRNRIVFGAISDTHGASIHAKRPELHDFIRFAHEEYGVTTMLHGGDFVAGQGVYSGQEGELTHWGMEAQVEQACGDLPEIKGLSYEIIGGNHDYSFTRRNGSDPLITISRLRKDIHSHGWFNAILDISGVKVELLHPEAGGAYAVSYYLQKHIESTPGGLKPQILLVGHYHQAIWLPGYRNVHGFYMGCFEGQSLYLKRKKLYPIIGGWVFDIGLDEDGSIREFLPRFINYFDGKRSIGVVGANR